MLCELSSLEPAPAPNFGHFKLTNCYGRAFIEGDDKHGYRIECKNKHLIGVLINGDKYVNATSRVLVSVPSGCFPWGPEIWQDNFRAIGGIPKKEVQPVQQITKEMLYCEICSVQCKDKRNFSAHLNSSRHKQEEDNYLQS